MKITSKTMVAAGFALLVGATACNNDNITNVNRNPNAPTSAPAGAVFTQATANAVGRFLGRGPLDLRGTEWVAQQLAEVQYPDEDRYARLQASSTAGTFNAAYTAELENLKKVVAQGQAAGQPGVWGPAAVLQTWAFGYMTDVWGDIPYTAALTGDSIGGSLTPAYDAQKDIYASFFKTLSAVSSALASDPATDPGLGSADPIYGGNLTAWEKFANSLHLRDAMRIVNVDPTTASAEIKAALSGPAGVFASNADNATLAWPGDGVFDNPWADNFAGRDDHRMSQTMMNVMLGLNDPRISVYAQPTVCFSAPSTTGCPANTPAYVGMPNGLDASTAGTYFNTSSRPGAVFYPGATAYGFYGGGGKSYPSNIMTYAEVAFTQAEAAERGLGGLTASQASGFYNAGITASMNQWGVTDPVAIATYLAQPTVAYQGGTAGLTQIATQKWLALYSDGTNAWAEWRRTCVPSTVKAGPAAIINYVPRRFEYSTTELSTNAANVNAAIARQGPDNFGSRMYWDTKP
ncbi:MAG: hypothetical protein B7Z72_06755, partial [Gemmatimonadetes bacterium 21-71-4]